MAKKKLSKGPGNTPGEIAAFKAEAAKTGNPTAQWIAGGAEVDPRSTEQAKKKAKRFAGDAKDLQTRYNKLVSEGKMGAANALLPELQEADRKAQGWARNAGLPPPPSYLPPPPPTTPAQEAAAGAAPTPGQESRTYQPWEAGPQFLPPGAFTPEAQAAGYWPGQDVVAFNPDEIAAQNTLRDVANVTIPGVTEALGGTTAGALGAWQDMITLEDITKNPQVMGIIAAMQGQANEAAQRGITQLASPAIEQGAYGGVRAGFLGNDLVRGIQADLGGRISQTYMDTYNRMLGDRATALGFTPTLQDMQKTPIGLGQLKSELLGNVGTQNRELEESRLGGQIDRFNYYRDLPWNTTAQTSGLLSGLGAMGGTQAGSATQPGVRGPNRLMTGVGGALGGAAAGAALGAAVGGPAAPLTAILGAALGGGLLGGGAGALAGG